MENKLACFVLGLNRIFSFALYKLKEPYSIKLLELVELNLLKSMKDSVNYVLFKKDILKTKELDEYSINYLKDALNMENKDVNTTNEKEINRYFPVMEAAVREIIIFLKDKNYEQAYDLLDAVHCLPEAILDKKIWNPKRYWKIYIKPYRKKWDAKFLIDKEKELFKIGWFRKRHGDG